MISVIIPVFNSAEKGLEQCLQSVASQSYADIQVIMVDDGSTDESKSICHRWVENDVRFRLFEQEHKGPAEARNTGLRQAEGSEIAFVDSDDLPDTDLLSSLFEALHDQNAEIAVANYHEGHVIQTINVEGAITGNIMLRGILAYKAPMCKALYAKLYRRGVVDGLWFNPLRTNEDIDFLSRIYLRVNNVAYVDRPLYRYNSHPDSIMHTQSAKDYMDILTCYESLFCRINNEANELRGLALDALMRKIVSSRYRNRIFQDVDLQKRLDCLQGQYLGYYLWCDNGNVWVKIGIIASLLMPGLHACIMNYRER